MKLTGSSNGNFEQFNTADLIALAMSGTLNNGRLVRRLTQFHSGSSQSSDPSLATFQLALVFEADTPGQSQILYEEVKSGILGIGFTIDDNFTTADALGGVVGAAEWALENNVNIPEINIAVDSVAVKTLTPTTTLMPRSSLPASSLSRLL